MKVTLGLPFSKLGTIYAIDVYKIDLHYCDKI